MNGFPRRLADETLDHLAEDDPRAIRSRGDLRRINRIMGAAGILLDAMSESGRQPRRILELGAGDGTLMLRLARRLAARWPDVELTLLDRQNVVSLQTRQEFRRLGWSAHALHADLMDWCAKPDAGHWDICVANLFIHHFDERQIATLFAALARRTTLFIACEPQRGVVPLAASRLVGLIGANDVTREDAVLSVKAGFRDTELSALWPTPQQATSGMWRLDERAARLFSHRFVASQVRGKW